MHHLARILRSACYVSACIDTAVIVLRHYVSPEYDNAGAICVQNRRITGAESILRQMQKFIGIMSIDAGNPILAKK